METAAAAAPEAPAIRTVLVSVVVAATPKIRPKIETVPSSIPKTTVPAELTNELRSRCAVEASVIIRVFLRRSRCGRGLRRLVLDLRLSHRLKDKNRIVVGLRHATLADKGENFV